MGAPISVISSVYNCVDDIPYFLHNSRDNAADYDQHYIVNDGSQDGTHQITQRLTGDAPIFAYRNSEQNRGLFPRKQALLDEVDTPFVVGLSHDDCLVPGYLAKAAVIAERYPDIGVIICNKLIIDGAGNFKTVDRPTVNTPDGPLRGDEFMNYYLLANAPYHSQDGGAVFRVEAAKRMVSDYVSERLGPFSDAFFLWMVGLQYGCVLINEIGHVLKQHENTWSGASELIQRHRLAGPIVDCLYHYLDLGLLSKRHSRQLLKRYVPLIDPAGSGRVF